MHCCCHHHILTRCFLFFAVDSTEEKAEEAAEAPNIRMSSSSKTNSKSSTGYVYKSDEQQWEAVHQSSIFISKGYYCEELIIEPPASFDGTEGTYQASFDEDNSVFVLKIAPNPVLNDPHALNSYYKNEYGLITADDSAREQAFRASAKCIQDKWYTYRHKLQWKGKPSEDLGRWWLDYTDIQLSGRVFPLLVIQLCSIKPVEVQSQKISMGLKKKTFKTPEKKNSNNKSPTAENDQQQLIAMLQELLPLMTPELQKTTAKKYGMTPEEILSSMQVNEARGTKRQHIESPQL